MILIALGSNLGDRSAMLEAARALMAQAGIVVTAQSGLHETPALLPENAPNDWNIAFLNQVIAVETELSPEDLLTRLKAIEQQLGRTDRGRWSPREIDLDILSYHREMIDTPYLQVPHPQMVSRLFVLAPLAEIAPDWVHPSVNKTTRQLLWELAR